MHKWPTFSRLVLVLSFAIAPLLLAPCDLAAQATAAAQRKGELSANVAYTLVWPKWNGISETNNGVTFGLDYARYYRLPFTPSLVFRGKIAPGNTVGERTFGGGLKAERAIGAFRPYGDFLISSGVITFTHPVIDFRGRLYTSDNSIVYSAGGGVDVDLTETWAARVDYQYEWWSIGINQNFNPSALSIGVVYRFPFRTF
jgi:hypothetical protein